MPASCNNVIYRNFFSSTCFGRIRPSSGALAVKLQHMVFCTQFVDGWWSWEPLRRSCVGFVWCRATALLHQVGISLYFKTLTILKLLGSKICDCWTICVVGYSGIYCCKQKCLFNPLRTKNISTYVSSPPPISERTLLFGRFTDLAHFSFL